MEYVAFFTTVKQCGGSVQVSDEQMQLVVECLEPPASDLASDDVYSLGAPCNHRL